MGLFGKKASTSAYEFEARLKSDPEFMLNVLNLFDDNPPIEKIVRGVKKLGFDLEPLALLKAVQNAGEHYKAMGGDSSGGSSSSGGGFMGFTQQEQNSID